MKTQYDVIIIGSGAGAMTSAITAHDAGLDVAVIEKSDKFGGTSALSGGGIWIPNNHLFKKKGGKDSKDLARKYLQEATKGEVSEARLEAYLDKSPEMIKYLIEHTQVRYAVATEYPDYYLSLIHI